jgi:hypothetical protein
VRQAQGDVRVEMPEPDLAHVGEVVVAAVAQLVVR